MRITTAFQGEPGAFSFSAATKLLGAERQTLPCEAFQTVFESVQTGAAQYAVIPIENTLHGSIHENYDHLLNYDLAIVGETSLRISHHLIALPGTRVRDVRQAFSHPVALNQCRNFFKKHIRIEAVPFYDTAGSVKMLMEQRPAHAAAIASEDASRLYRAEILERNIEDNRQNFTRFFLLSKQQKRPGNATGPWKTSVLFATPNQPGALFKAMGCFALRDLNLTKLESRPLRSRPWEYLFYLDILGDQKERPVQRALEQLQEITSLFRVLGSYQPTI